MRLNSYCDGQDLGHIAGDAIPIVPVELGGLLNPFWAMVIYSWYWWMYAINVIVYVFTSRDFRNVYAVFMHDMSYPVRTFVRHCLRKENT